MIKSSFSGGSINSTTFPIVIETMLRFKNAGVDVFEDFFLAAKYWDRHVIATIPPLAERLSPYAGRQFTPADPIVIVGLADGNFIEDVEPIRVTFDLESPVERSGYEVEIGPNRGYNESKPWWEDGQLGFVSVEKVNSGFFGEFVTASFDRLGSRLLRRDGDVHSIPTF